MKKIYLMLIVLWPLFYSPFFAFGRSEEVTVSHLSLQLGQKATLGLDTDQSLLNAVSSQDRVLSMERNTVTTPNSVVVEAIGFGEATVSLFATNGIIRIFRISVLSQGIQIPAQAGNVSPTSEGSRGTLGSRIGFRSRHGLFEELAQQEEYFDYQIKGKKQSQSLQLRTTKPLSYSEPKAARVLDSLSYQYETGQTLLSLGDTDPLNMRTRGNVRGLRFDLLEKAHRPYLVLGFARSGVRNFLWGTDPTAVGALGDRFSLSKEFSVNAYVLGFKKNENLLLKSDGMEGGLGFKWGRGWVRELSLGVTGDKVSRISYEGNLLLDLEPLSLTLFGGHMANNAEVYTLPSRFGPGFDSYGASLGLQPPSGLWQLGATASRGLQFASLDGVLGRSDLKNFSASAAGKLGTLHSSLSGSLFDSSFSILDKTSSLTANSERGQRLEWSNEYELNPKKRLTLAAMAGNTQSQFLELNYENEDLAVGLKHLFQIENSDYLHLELGLSRFRYPNLPVQNGTYFLSRLTSLIRQSQLRLEGVVQNELRITGAGKQNNLRLQASLQYLPNARHELGLNAFNQFEWQRRLHSDYRGLYFQYSYHFGSLVAESSLFSKAKGYSVSGRVRLDKEDTLRVEKNPYSQLEILLTDSNKVLQRRAMTDGNGHFVFEDLKSGEYWLSLDQKQLRESYRLTTANPLRVEVIENSKEQVDFVFSRNASIQGIVYNDLNGNRRADKNEPLVEDIRIRYRAHKASSENRQWRTTPASEGQFQVEALPPGDWEIGLDPASLPPGFRWDLLSTKRVAIKPNTIISMEFPIQAERSLSGMIFQDRNHNRIFDGDDKPIDGVTVEFAGRKTQSGEGGHFLFRHLPAIQGKVRYGTAESETVRLLEEPTQLLNVFVPLN